MPKTSRFEYTPRDPSTLQDRASQRGGDFDSIFKAGTKLFKPREGKNIIRILPPSWPNPKHYGFDIWVNYGIGVDTQTYLSLSKMKDERDPIVEARQEANRNGDKKLADSLEPKRRVLMYIIDRSAEDQGPQLWSAPWTVDKAFAALSFDEDTKELVMVDSPDEGADIKFVKETKGDFPKYPPELMRIFKPSHLHEDERTMNEWLDFIVANPIPALLNYYSYDHISEVFSGHVTRQRPADEAVLSTDFDPKDVKRHEEDGVEFDDKKYEESAPTTVDAIRARLANRGKPPVEPPFDDDEEAPSISQRARAARR